MSTSSNLKNLAISETGFVFDPFSGATYSLNTTGLIVVQSLRDGLGINQIGQLLNTQFDEASNSVRDDILDFINVLRQHGLLAADFQPAT